MAGRLLLYVDRVKHAADFVVVYFVDGLALVRVAAPLQADLHNALGFLAAAIMRSPSSGVWEAGFSQYTCLPAAQAEIVAGACQWFGAATDERVDGFVVERLAEILDGLWGRCAVGGCGGNSFGSIDSSQSQT